MRKYSSGDIRPKSVAGEYVIHPVEDEILIYNLETDFAACLEVRAYTIWQLCNGTNTVEQISQKYNQANTGHKPEEDAKTMILEVLDQLKSIELIEPESLPSKIVPLQRDRREFLKRAAITGVPLVVGLPIPAAAQSASCLPRFSICNSDSECCSGICRGFFGFPKRCRNFQFP
ncbi:MAG: PqqD family protein [Rhizobiaceae bacterium]